jgi:hypothetical protein
MEMKQHTAYDPDENILEGTRGINSAPWWKSIFDSERNGGGVELTLVTPKKITILDNSLTFRENGITGDFDSGKKFIVVKTLNEANGVVMKKMPVVATKDSFTFQDTAGDQITITGQPGSLRVNVKGQGDVGPFDRFDSWSGRYYVKDAGSGGVAEEDGSALTEWLSEHSLELTADYANFFAEITMPMAKTCGRLLGDGTITTSITVLNTSGSEEYWEDGGYADRGFVGRGRVKLAMTKKDGGGAVIETKTISQQCSFWEFHCQPNQFRLWFDEVDFWDAKFRIEYSFPGSRTGQGENERMVAPVLQIEDGKFPDWFPDDPDSDEYVSIPILGRGDMADQLENDIAKIEDTVS